jgi:NADPH:quinone reductase-like Zn-dependent oxidoreductase
MEAMVLDELGGFEHLRPAILPLPEPAEGEVLVRVATVAVNRQDINLVFGHFTIPGLPLPHVLGLDPAGVVVATGAGVTTPMIGDRVVAKAPIACMACAPCLGGDDDACERIRSLGIHRPGGMAEYVAVPATNAFVLPRGVAFEEATAISHSFPVALTLLRRAGVRTGETVLVSGASGAVGSAVVQLARRQGARVIGLVGQDAGAEWLRALPADVGPDHVLDHGREPAFAPLVPQIAPAGVDVYVETASQPAVWSEALKTLARQARVAVIGAHGGPIVEVNNNWLFRQRITILGCSGSTVAAFAEVIELAGAGRIVPHIDSIRPMREAADAYGRLLARQNQGKIVLRVAEDEPAEVEVPWTPTR